jgi:NAD/NADP transhydrogenase beta subunit
MEEATDGLGERGEPMAGLVVALTIALAGFCCALIGFVVDDTTSIVAGLVVGASGSIAVNGLANSAERWRRPHDEHS